MPASVRPRRSILYMPGSNPRALEKGRALPADGLLLETDAPDQPGAQHRGERNEPALNPVDDMSNGSASSETSAGPSSSRRRIWRRAHAVSPHGTACR